MTLVRVAFQGERGAFSEDAIMKFFISTRVVTVPERRFDDVVAAVLDGRTEYGVLPVENTIAGIVIDAERSLAESSLRTIGEVSVRIEQCLLAVRGARLGDVSRVMS